MKTLYVSNLCFHLPANFKGSDMDAIRLLLNHMEKVNYPSNTEDLSSSKELDVMNHGAVRMRIWEDYLEGVAQGKLLCGDIQIAVEAGSNSRNS